MLDCYFIIVDFTFLGFYSLTFPHFHLFNLFFENFQKKAENYPHFKTTFLKIIHFLHLLKDAFSFLVFITYSDQQAHYFRFLPFSLLSFDLAEAHNLDQNLFRDDGDDDDPDEDDHHENAHYLPLTIGCNDDGAVAPYSLFF